MNFPHEHCPGVSGVVTLPYQQRILRGNPMNITSRKQKDVIILCPEGKITLGDGDQELGEAVRQALEEGARKMIINFTKVTYLDSSGVGELVGCYTSIKNRGGELRICGMNSRIFGLIKMTSLHSVFEVKDTEEESLAGF
jgi:anti-anti-sigma factor